jgi:hypothetical protein
MKKFSLKWGLGTLLIAVVAMVAALTLASNAPGPATGCISSTYMSSSVYPVSVGGYRTIAGAATDTLRTGVSCSPATLTFFTNVLKVAGTPTVTVNCYASADGGNTYADAAIASYTVQPSSTTVPLTNNTIINSSGGGHNPFTHYMWVASNSVSSTITWKHGGTPRQ